MTAHPLTPDARVERAKRLLAESIAELVSAQIEKGAAAADWVDQSNSPLGRRRHLALARRGAIPSTRDGRRVLVRRGDVDAYLRKNAVIRVDEDAEEREEIARLAAMINR